MYKHQSHLKVQIPTGYTRNPKPDYLSTDRNNAAFTASRSNPPTFNRRPCRAPVFTCIPTSGAQPMTSETVVVSKDSISRAYSVFSVSLLGRVLQQRQSVVFLPARYLQFYVFVIFKSVTYVDRLGLTGVVCCDKTFLCDFF